MTADDVAKWIGIIYALASGLSFIFSGLEKAFDTVKAFSKLATIFSTVAVDFQKLMGGKDAPKNPGSK